MEILSRNMFWNYLENKSKRLYPVKPYQYVFSLCGLLFFLLSFSGCTKEDLEEERKEALTYRLTGDINTDSLEAFVTWMQDMGTRFALAGNHREVACRIKNRFSGMGYSDTRIDSFEITRIYHDSTYIQWQYNVVATLKGSHQPDSVSIIGAHYDCITREGDPFTLAPGANDNASGVAGAMEIARVMKKNNYLPASTIKFVAFGVEELGLYGSSAYANDARELNEGVKFMLNNDMIAYEPGSDQAVWRVNILDYDNSHSLRNEAEMLCQQYTVLTPYNDNTVNNRSDSYPFFLYGFKALFFFSDIMDPDYHSANDVASHCNFEYCREIVKLNCAVLVNNN
jgi:hypothetical protein